MTEDGTLTMTLNNGAYKLLNEVLLENKGMTLEEFAEAHPNKMLEMLKEYFEKSIGASARVNMTSGDSHTVILGDTSLARQSDSFQSIQSSLESDSILHLKVEQPQTLWQFLTGQTKCKTIVIERQ